MKGGEFVKEIHYPWMDNKVIPDPPPEIKKCQVHRFPGVKAEDHTDPGPFRRCGCDSCKRILKLMEKKNAR